MRSEVIHTSAATGTSCTITLRALCLSFAVSIGYSAQAEEVLGQSSLHAEMEPLNRTVICRHKVFSNPSANRMTFGPTVSSCCGHRRDWFHGELVQDHLRQAPGAHPTPIHCSHFAASQCLLWFAASYTPRCVPCIMLLDTSQCIALLAAALFDTSPCVSLLAASFVLLEKSLFQV